MFSWIKKSNRLYHFYLGMAAAIVGTIIGAIEVACAFEGKDCQHDPANANVKPWKWTFRCWDWLDWLATVLGGLVGQVIQALIILLLIWIF